MWSCLIPLWNCGAVSFKIDSFMRNRENAWLTIKCFHLFALLDADSDPFGWNQHFKRWRKRIYLDLQVQDAKSSSNIKSNKHRNAKKYHYIVCKLASWLSRSHRFYSHSCCCCLLCQKFFLFIKSLILVVINKEWV